MGKYLQFNGHRYLLFGTIPMADGWNKIYYWDQNEPGKIESRMVIGKIKALSHAEFEMIETQDHSASRQSAE
ncbi:hypothetical protein EDC14_1001189 [Hydrogenispora ethanolica]|jgi:hypothetical protein|uniref:Uncharacterized protein n=1 Tax=Hydrogenispora ethanolica TaxID=1082276 RepID=A0A4R1SC87_HYDET|nr:hypothetical protein [Hydrogenispora ethanolica]TCL76904.1 hypothetical protein EDC14_1001189 [Hydrogenispora ethanolica]